MTGAPRRRRVALATGLTYHVLEWGQGDHTLVLVHGFLDLAWAWAEVGAALADRFHVIAPDLRGHGDSDWIGPGGYYHFFDYLADLDDLIDRLGRTRVSLVGHSMGGSVTAYWAGTRPARAHALVLLEGLGPPEMTTPVPDRAAGWIDAWKRARTAPPRVMASLEAAAARIRRHDPLIDEPAALRMAELGTRAVAGGLVWKHDPLHLTQGPYPYRVDVADSFWRRVTAPTLYLAGGASRLRLPDAEIERRLAGFASARTAVIEGAGHALHRHQPAAVAAAVAEHVSAGQPAAD